MRIPFLAAFILFGNLGGSVSAATGDGWEAQGGPPYEAGIGATAGMSDSQAVYLKGSIQGRRQPSDRVGSYYVVGWLERSLPLTDWRGKRLRLSLRLKNEGRATTNVALTFLNRDGPATVAHLPGWPRERWSTDDGGAWRLQEFVLDVPTNADQLILGIGMKDKGMVWVDGLKLEAVGTNVPLTRSSTAYLSRAFTHPLIDPAMYGNEGFGAY